MYSKCHLTSNKVTSKLECAEDKFQTRGWVRETPPTTTVHSRRRESHRKQMHVISSSLLEWNHAAITWSVYLCRVCLKSECRLTCVRMQWVPWTTCALCPLLAVSCGDTGLGLFTLTVSSPRMDCSYARDLTRNAGPCSKL
jgi:hypothetical protein